jgi:hypothetical protein
VFARLHSLISFGCDRPFWASSLDDLDCICCLSILLHVVGTLFFNNVDFFYENGAESSSPRIFEAALIATNLVALLFIMKLFLKQLIEKAFSEYALRTVISRVVLLVVDLQKQLGANRDQFVGILNLDRRCHEAAPVVTLAQFKSAVALCLAQQAKLTAHEVLEAIFQVLKRIEEDSADAEGLELLLRAPPGAMLLHSHHSHRPHGTESSHTFRSSAVRGESVADSPGKPDNPDAISMQLVRFWPKPEPPPLSPSVLSSRLPSLLTHLFGINTRDRTHAARLAAAVWFTLHFAPLSATSCAACADSGVYRRQPALSNR